MPNMPSPFVFLIVVVIFDLISKSVKKKKKREQSMRRDLEQAGDQIPTSPTKTTSNGPIAELKRMLEEELGKENEAKRQENQELDKTIDTVEKRKTRDDLIAEQRKKANEHSEFEKMKRRRERIESDRQASNARYDTPLKQALVTKTHKDKNEFRKDILNGIIFSEILGKPKSLRK